MKLIRKIFNPFSLINPKDFKKTQFAKLGSRSLLIVNGPDSRKLLQGLVTSDIKELKNISLQDQKSQRVSIYALFLQQKGKVLSDAFIMQPRIYKQGKAIYSPDELWIDIPKEAKFAVKQHIKRHMWKKEVELHDVEQEQQEFKPAVYAGCNQDNYVYENLLGASVQLEELEQGQDGSYANLIFFDPRGGKFGLRVISMQPEFSVSGHFQEISEENLTLMQQKLGQVPFQLYSGKLPFQFNFDLQNGISLKKGCYLGQEVASRGLMTGIIRKRIFPFVLEDDKEVAEGSTLMSQTGEQLGKVVLSNKRQGLAVVNYLPFMENKRIWPIKFKLPASGSLLNPLQKSLESYFNNIKEKQKIMSQLDL